MKKKRVKIEDLPKPQLPHVVIKESGSSAAKGFGAGFGLMSGLVAAPFLVVAALVIVLLLLCCMCSLCGSITPPAS